MPARVNPPLPVMRCVAAAARLGAASLSAACLCTATFALPAEGAAPADLVLFHGRIITMDPGDSIVEALAVRGGKIIATGSDEAILRLAGAATRRIDLRGRAATPGLIDTHAHIAEGGVDDLYHVHLGDVSGVEEAVRRVQAGLAGLPPGAWLQGDGWDEGKLAERRYLTAADLDRVSPGNPVWLMHTTGHYGVANSAALRLAGIGAGTTDPVAGTIDRNAAGMPTGVLKEAAMRAVLDLVPPPTAAEEREGILKIIDTLHREGITAVKDPSITQPVWNAYASLLKEGKLGEHLWRASLRDRGGGGHPRGAALLHHLGGTPALSGEAHRLARARQGRRRRRVGPQSVRDPVAGPQGSALRDDHPAGRRGLRRRGPVTRRCYPAGSC